MRWKECACPSALRIIPIRRKVSFLIVCALLVGIQLWYPLIFQWGDDTLLIKHHLSKWNAILKHRYQSLVEESELKVTTADEDFPYSYVISEPNYCSNRSDLYIINIVGTAPWEFKARNRIRRLWANETYRNLTGFSTVFFIGQISDETIMNDVKTESDKYRDVILLDVLDSYTNLTLKTLALFHWVDRYCPNPVWVLKSDADVFVNTFALSRYLHKVQDSGRRLNNTFVCKKRGPASPCRVNCPHAKWRVSWEEYPKDKYPEYCMGPGYVIPRSIIRPIYEAANKTHPFRMEDVYYTGILPDTIKVARKKHSIRSRFPWRPKSWQDSFVFGDLMILELDKRLGRGASALVWSNILKSRGLIKEVDGLIQA
ncbi:beta-1,3-galactosyltransferase 1-like isoform X2 [Macrobrachium nipponense]|uniref:beta-1,3-galactosyltransferase 1-like isoform X2 n=1 Tax=Macrobrachium nipponense TaxID=159736 RepID=UPI0030C7EF43